MDAIVLPAQADPGHPRVNKSSILASADMIGVIEPVRKDELVKGAASAARRVLLPWTSANLVICRWLEPQVGYVAVRRSA
jgi:hypothetical protein